MNIFTKAVLALSLSVATINVYAQRVTVTMAGNGAGGFNGDGTAGYITDVNAPLDVCVDAAHNIYIIDEFNHLVRKISSATGLVTTIGGGGTSYSDGVPATDEVLDPYYMCIDAVGNIYFSSNNEIKKITAATGIITTVAGTSGSGHTGDGGAATAATMYTPQGVCIDAAGNLYIVDQGNSCIRKVTASTGIITTIAGTGTSGYAGDGAAATAAELSTPIAICVNAAGNVFFSDQDGNYIREINVATGIISTIAGNGSMASGDGGPATAAGIGWVMGMCCDGGGNIYCCDISCSCRRIDASTGIITTVAGSDLTDGYNGDGGNALNIWFNYPHGVCVDEIGTLYVADQNNNRIRKSIQLTNTPSFAFGKGVYFYPCAGVSLPINDKAAITNMNAGETETWTVVSAPAYGSLTGFPYSAASNGTAGLTIPSGLSYTSTSGFSGTDSFKIMVSNGTLSDVLTMYASVGTVAPPSLSGPGSVCTGQSIFLTESLPGGLVTATNSNAYADTTVSGNIWGMSAGLDTISYSLSGVCVASPITITVNTSPDPGIISGSTAVCIGSSITLSDYVSGGTWSVDMDATVDASGDVTGMSNGTATISYTVNNATCTAIAILPVTVGTPSGTISLGAVEFCPGSTSFVSNGVSGGVWSVTNGSATMTTDSFGTEYVNGISGGVDTIIYTVTNICGTSFATSVVTVDPAPDAGVITGIDNVIVGAATTLANTVTGGVWSSTNLYISTVSAAGLVNGVNVGSDSIVYTTTLGSCSSSAYFSFTVLPDVSTGISNVTTTGDRLTVMPNPAKDNFVVTIASQKDEQVIITISDITGAKVKSITSKTNQPINASLHVPAGIYLLNATTIHDNMSGKIVIE
jgi:sugar lactone lactonase YvrE